MSRDYRNIIAFQRADGLVVQIYDATRTTFPKEELYGLTAQVRRAAVSVAANIVEGSARQYLKEFLQFLYTAKSSLSETEYYVHLGKRLSYLNEVTAQSLTESVAETGRVVHGLIESVEAQIESGAVYDYSSKRARRSQPVAPPTVEGTDTLEF